MKLADSFCTHKYGAVYKLNWLGKDYVGSCKNLYKRMNQWKYDLKYQGIPLSDVQVDILWVGPDELRKVVEKQFVIKFDSFNYGHNKTPSGGQKGIVVSETTKLKIRESKMGVQFSVESKAKMAAAKLGKPMPQYVRQKISDSMRNRYQPQPSQHL